MAKDIIHAISSAKRYGGTPEDYVAIHRVLDSSKSTMADNRHRILTHTNWFVKNILTGIFGDWFVVPTTDEGREIAAEIAQREAEIQALKERMRAEKLGRVVSVTQIGEDHVLEDFGGKFIPTVQDYVESSKMQMADWFNNAQSGHPPSYDGIASTRKVTRILLD